MIPVLMRPQRQQILRNQKQSPSCPSRHWLAWSSFCFTRVISFVLLKFKPRWSLRCRLASPTTSLLYAPFIMLLISPITAVSPANLMMHAVAMHCNVFVNEQQVQPWAEEHSLGQFNIRNEEFSFSLHLFSTICGLACSTLVQRSGADGAVQALLQDLRT